MTPSRTLLEWLRLGGEVATEGAQLRCRIGRGVASAQLLDALRRNKEGVRRLLGQVEGMEPDGVARAGQRIAALTRAVERGAEDVSALEEALAVGALVLVRRHNSVGRWPTPAEVRESLGGVNPDGEEGRSHGA